MDWNHRPLPCQGKNLDKSGLPRTVLDASPTYPYEYERKGLVSRGTGLYTAATDRTKLPVLPAVRSKKGVNLKSRNGPRHTGTANRVVLARDLQLKV